MNSSILFQQQYQLQTIQEQYTSWTKTANKLYSTIFLNQLATLSNTFEWLPERQRSSDGNHIIMKCLVGARQSQDNSLALLRVVIPVYDFCDLQQRQIGDKQGAATIQTSLAQNSEVMKARSCPAKPSLVVSKCGKMLPQVNIYDLSDVTKHHQQPLIKLAGHTRQGSAVDWNRQRSNMLASGCYQGKICIWDIEGSKQTDSLLQPLVTLKLDSAIEDVHWSRKNPNILATASNNQLICIWDLRDKAKQVPQYKKVGHAGAVYSIDFSAFSQMLFISGGEDNEVGLWDLRNISKRIHTFTGHNGAVRKVQFSPHSRQLLSSCCEQRRIVLWDMNRCGQLDEYEQPAEIRFIHAGHRSGLVDMDWSPQQHMIGSIDSARKMQLWKPVASLQLSDF